MGLLLLTVTLLSCCKRPCGGYLPPSRLFGFGCDGFVSNVALYFLCLLLSCDVPPGRAEGAQPSFTIKDIHLALEPGAAVRRDTNVTLRCQATISSYGHQLLSRTYTIRKDDILIYTKTTSMAEDLVYPLPQARVSNTGKYTCQVYIEGKDMKTEPKKLTVTGLSTPELLLSRRELSEGQDVNATCTAPGERGSIIFYFYADSKEVKEVRVSTNHATAALRLSSTGIHKLHCSYKVLITADVVTSQQSNVTEVLVKELLLSLLLQISPQQRIYEGDPLNISCTVNDVRHDYGSIYLSQGSRLLGHGTPRVQHSMRAVANDSGEFECRLMIGHFAKVTTATVSVTELFSAPTLTMSPKDVFQEDRIKLTCQSAAFASERLRREELIYTIDPQGGHLVSGGEAGVFVGKTLPYDFNYTCSATAKGIVKHSQTLTVRPKVPVSQPRLLVVSRVILGRLFQVLCQSDRGSLPINYSLWRRSDLLRTITVKQPLQQAIFNLTIQQHEEIHQYTCEAQNNAGRVVVRSKTINTSVTVPVSDPLLTVLPDLRNIAEGERLYLICSVKGTPPITFKWYRSSRAKPLYTNTSNKLSLDYQVPELGRDHSDTYYCEAGNYANSIRSPLVTVDVSLAMWKKGLIAASCLLVVAVLVMLLVLRLRAKRGQREAAAELSVKPSSPKSDDSLTVSLSHDTEVYDAATDATPR